MSKEIKYKVTEIVRMETEVMASSEAEARERYLLATADKMDYLDMMEKGKIDLRVSKVKV